jgi:glucose/arabinose dehydrogenase
MKNGSIIRVAYHSFSGAVFAGVVMLIASSVQAQNLFVSSYFNGTIVEITPGGMQSIFASGLATPEGIAFNSAGDLFVAEFGAANGNYGSIVKITPGGVKSIFASGLNSPVALAFNSTGDLFVDSYSSGSIVRITPSGVQTSFASGLYYPQGMAFNSTGDLFVTSSSSILRFTPDGVRSTFASGLQSPYGVAINSADYVIEADDAALTLNVFAPNGTRSTVGSGLFNVYNCLAVDSADNVFAGEWGTGGGYNGSIVEITPGGVQSTFASGLYSPTGLAFEPVPEPSVLGLLAIGATALHVCRRRNRIKTKFTSTIRAACHSFRGVVCVGVVMLIASSVQAQNLFVSTYPHGIAEITPSGTVSTFASLAYPPRGLAFNSAGDLFAVNITLGSITKIAPDGTQSTFASGLDAFRTIGLAINGADNLFVVSSSYIYQFTPDGTQSTFASGLSYPDSLAFNSAGDLFVSQLVGLNGEIVRIAPDGTQSIFASGLNSPSGLAFNSAGDLFVGDLSGYIYEFTPDGTRSTFAAGLNGPIGLAFNSAGNLFEGDNNSGNIFEFTPDGTRSTFASGLNSPNYLVFQPVPEPSVLGLLAIGVTIVLARCGACKQHAPTVSIVTSNGQYL